MKLNEIYDNPGARYKAKRVGRGIGSGKGKTAGSGTKGQKSRTGVAINGFEGGQMPIHRRLPKRGFNNIFRQEYAIINLGQVQGAIDVGLLANNSVITKEMLVKAGVLRSLRQPVKLLAKGKIVAAVTIEVDAVSESAKSSLEKVGGKVIVPSTVAA